MKNGKNIPNATTHNEYRDRLIRLYKSKEIDINKHGWSLQVAKDMFNVGILRYEDYTPQYDSYGNDITIPHTNDNVAKKLRTHVAYNHKNQLNADSIKMYCDYFGCSSDYLLGYIDTPTHTQYDDVPLRFETIQALKRMRENYLEQGADCMTLALYGIVRQPYQPIDLLNFVLCNPNFEYILYKLEHYIKPEYNIPMFYVDSNQAPYYKGYHVPHNPIHEKAKVDDDGKIILDDIGRIEYERYLPLVKDSAIPTDYRSITINEGFMESVAMLDIQKAISNLKQDYIKAQSKAPDAKQKTKATKRKENRKNEKAKQ